MVIVRIRDGLEGAERIAKDGIGGTGGSIAEVSAELSRSTRAVLVSPSTGDH